MITVSAVAFILFCLLSCVSIVGLSSMVANQSESEMDTEF